MLIQAHNSKGQLPLQHLGTKGTHQFYTNFDRFNFVNVPEEIIINPSFNTMQPYIIISK